MSDTPLDVNDLMKVDPFTLVYQHRTSNKYVVLLIEGTDDSPCPDPRCGRYAEFDSEAEARAFILGVREAGEAQDLTLDVVLREAWFEGDEEDDDDEEDESDASHMIVAASETLGREVTDGELRNALAEWEHLSDKALEEQLRLSEHDFESRGGRGVELADEIDKMRMALAARGV